MTFFTESTRFFLVAPWSSWQFGLVNTPLVLFQPFNGSPVEGERPPPEESVRQNQPPAISEESLTQTPQCRRRRSRGTRKRSKVTPRYHWKGLPREYNRKHDRNVLTNLGNQALVFAYHEDRSRELVQRCFPELTQEQVAEFYRFAKQTKRALKGYLNEDKLKNLWLTEHRENALNYKILRTICYHFIRFRMVMPILTSKKMLSALKPLHLKVRRQLLSFFHEERPA